MTRDVDQLAIFTRGLSVTPHDEANRAAVSAVPSEGLDLVGIAVRAARKSRGHGLGRFRFGFGDWYMPVRLRHVGHTRMLEVL
jgi:hypothetical protein